MALCYVVLNFSEDLAGVENFFPYCINSTGLEASVLGNESASTDKTFSGCKMLQVKSIIYLVSSYYFRECFLTQSILPCFIGKMI